jgi:ubiquinone/menaquinone biosynthesis C-methylase UbiE
MHVKDTPVVDAHSSTFNSGSRDYSLYRPNYPREIYTFINEQCASHHCAWDSACGNGQVAIDLVPYFSRIEASDIHENQIQHAFRHEKISYSVQNSERTSFPNHSFDAVCIAQAIHWLDLERYFREVGRVLKRNGLFAYWGYGFFHITPAIDEIIENCLLEKIKPYWSEKCRILHDGYNDIALPFERIKTPQIEFTETWSLHQLLSYLSTWSAIKLYQHHETFDLLKDLEKQLLDQWAMNETHEITIDFFFHAGRNS